MADPIDTLSAAIEQLSREVSEGLAERARYTDDAYVTLDAKMHAGFAHLDSKMDTGFARVDTNAARLEGKLDAGFARIERKLDQFIDTQIQTNQIMDRRLRLVEE